MAAGFNDYFEKCKVLPVNSEIAEKYISFLQSKVNPREATRLGYCNMVLMFLQSLDEEIALLTIDDVANYKEVRKQKLSDNRLNDVLSRIADFIEFCTNDGMNVKISKADILNLRIPSDNIRKSNVPKVIAPIKIMELRHKLIEKGDIRRLLTFELLYSFGLREKDLIFFTLDKYNKYEGTFTYKDKVYTLPIYLRELIATTPEEALEKYRTYGGKETEAFKGHIAVAGDLIGEKLKISDLTKTHEDTSIKCFHCGRAYPPEAQYWKLKIVEFERVQSYFHICNDCGKEKTGYEQNSI